MTVYDQQSTSYSDLTADVRVISDVIKMIDPRDTPTLWALGGLDSARSKLRIRQNGTKIEWLEDELDPLTGKLAESTTVTTTATTLTVADASVFQDGHVILIDSEKMVVKSADVSANSITVYSRSYGGTNATHAATADITIVGMARLEGDDADFGPIVDITAPFNYTGIFEKAFNISRTQQVIDKYGMGNYKEYQVAKQIPNLLRLVDRAIFYGVASLGTASAPRSMGGLLAFITDNSVNAGGAISKADLDDAVEFCYSDGGNPDMIICNPAVARDLKDVIDSTNYVQVGLDNNVIGMAPIQRIQTQFGKLDLVMDRHCPVANAFVVESSRIGLYTLSPFAWSELGKTGDGNKVDLVGEFSLAVANDKAHAYIYGITS